ncbi:hypothetical protein NHF46_13460 [Arthrobacter alpinus]|nr:hypothetical protein [Arthrobacter alpinus]
MDDSFFAAPAGNDPFGLARAVAAKEAKNAEPYDAANYLNGAVGDAVIKQVQLAIIGEKAPQQALTDGQNAANKLLAAISK